MMLIKTMKFTLFLLVSIKLSTCQINLESTGVSEKVKGFVGSTFRHELEFFKNEEASADRKELKLLTKNENELEDETWLQLDLAEKAIYGFPLPGNEGTSTFIVKTTKFTNDGEKKSRIKVNVFVKETFEEHFHEIKLCTTLTLDLFLKDINIRYELAEMLAFYLLQTQAANFFLKKFEDGCIWFSFKNIEDGATCSFEMIDLLRRQLFIDDRISEDFLRSVEHVTSVKSVNLTLTGPCIRPVIVEKEKDLHWLKTVAPILILLAIVGIPVSISCYVCRGVRRRQNKMRQQQDKLAREDQIRLNEQMQEYKEACGLDDAEDSDSSDVANQTKWKTEPKEEKQVFLARLFEQYMPQSIQDKFDIGKSVFDYTKKKSTEQKMFKKPMNPVSRILDIRSATVIEAQNRASNPLYTKSRKQMDMMTPSRNRGIASSSILATSNLNLMKKLGATASQLSINYKNHEVNPQLDSWRRLNSSIAINNGIEDYDHASLKHGGSMKRLINEHLLRNNSAPIHSVDSYGRLYKNGSTQMSRSFLYNSNPQLRTASNNNLENSHFNENNRGKSVSFYNVSNAQEPQYNDSVSVYRQLPKLNSRSCNDLSGLNRNTQRSYQQTPFPINSRYQNGTYRSHQRSIQTQTFSVIGNMKIIANTKTQKLKSSIKNGRILGSKTRDMATSPSQPKNKAFFRRRPTFRNRLNFRNSNASLQPTNTKTKPCLRKTNQSSQCISPERDTFIAGTSPRDTFIADTLDLPEYNSLYPTNDLFREKRNFNFDDEIISTSEDLAYYSLNNHPFDDQNAYRSYDNLPYNNNNNNTINGYNNKIRKGSLEQYYDSKDLYSPRRSLIYNNEFSTDEQSFDSTINTSNFEQPPVYPGHRSQSYSPTQKDRLSLRRRIFHEQTPQMSNSFDIEYENLESSFTSTPSSELVSNRRNLLEPMFPYEESQSLIDDYKTNQLYDVPMNDRQLYIRNSTSMPNMQKKENWKSFDSEITYVDFGSEYEIKAPTHSIYANDYHNMDYSSNSPTPKISQSPIFMKLNNQQVYL